MIVDGVELLRMIRDEEIKEGTKIRYKNETYFFNGVNIEKEDKARREYLTKWLDDLIFASSEFEILLEEKEEPIIDIQAIEEINFLTGANDNELDIGNKMNELIKAVKQLDKEMKREKENS